MLRDFRLISANILLVTMRDYNTSWVNLLPYYFLLCVSLSLFVSSVLISGVEAATLSSTLPYEGNSITACPSSNVILTCMVTQRPLLRWEAVPGLSERTFIPDDIDRDIDTLVEGLFTLTLVNVSHRTQSDGGLADLTSTLEVMVEDIDDGTNITCKGTTDEDYVVIHKRGCYAHVN